MFLFIVIISHRCFRSRFTYHLICISVFSDLTTDLMLTVNYAYNISNISNAILGQLICKVIISTMSISYGVSTMTLCIIAIGHYLTISKSLESCSPCLRRNAALISELVIVALAILISFPFFNTVISYKDQPTFCDFGPITPNLSIYLIMHSIFFYFIPSVLLVLIYWRIIHKLKRFKRPIRPYRIIFMDRKKRKLIKMLIVITTLDVLITWPCFASTLTVAITRNSLRQLGRINPIYPILTMISLATTVAISIVNPISFFAMDSDIKAISKALLKKWARPFRMGFLSILTICRRHRHIQPISPLRSGWTITEVHSFNPNN
ncbi:Galanin receptor type 2 [Trichoplax sp. H2]|nr:Galanin receptor type 2 [Trichoplax sp. H2]|eukprot:RDD37841.1 Galanin receptor type 2 [Trichoplax sp. H2]